MKVKIQTVVAGFVVLTALVFAVSSCSKKTENQAPVITLSEPGDGESISITDSLHIMGTLTDDESLHEASILVIGSGGDTAFQEYPVVHDLATYTFHYHFHPTHTGNYTLQVTAEDHDEAHSEKSVSVSVN